MPTSISAVNIVQAGSACTFLRVGRSVFGCTITARVTFSPARSPLPASFCAPRLPLTSLSLGGVGCLPSTWKFPQPPISPRPSPGARSLPLRGHSRGEPFDVPCAAHSDSAISVYSCSVSVGCFVPISPASKTATPLLRRYPSEISKRPACTSVWPFLRGCLPPTLPRDCRNATVLA
jgi:hypothetical protein